MKKYLFLTDYRGKETQEQFVGAGDVFALDEGAAQLLLSNGWVKELDAPKAAPKPEPKPEPAPEPEKPVVVVSKRAKRGGGG